MIRSVFFHFPVQNPQSQPLTMVDLATTTDKTQTPQLANISLFWSNNSIDPRQIIPRSEEFFPVVDRIDHPDVVSCPWSLAGLSERQR